MIFTMYTTKGRSLAETNIYRYFSPTLIESNIMRATSDAGTVYPSGAPDITPGF
jgi:hypothetical protein